MSSESHQTSPNTVHLKITGLLAYCLHYGVFVLRKSEGTGEANRGWGGGRGRGGFVCVCVWWWGGGGGGGGRREGVVTDGPPQNYISKGQNAVKLSGVTASESCDGEVTHRCVLRTRWNDTGQ